LKVSIRLYGVFRSAAGSGSIQLELADSTSTVRAAIVQLVSHPAYRGIKQLLLDQGTTDPRSNALIMVSGREIGTLDGLDTKLGDSDELSLLPIAHGG
jgi:molybdopterin converting factor small subunit